MTHPTLRPLLAALSLAASLLGSSRALAISSCTISSVTSVAFGAYDPFSGSPLDSAGSLTYSCVGVGGSDTILIQLGRGSSSSFFPRRMNNGGAALDYNLFLDASRLSVWGDGSQGTSQLGPFTPPENTSATINIYGRIPAGQNIPEGVYGDTLVITLLY